ncbi:MAG TPA: 1-(5-phosphoribosyl)-5-[(5-phosphoribosylamino)methylideneamino]imidazole-4-carboxamide isomerase [Sedimentisphaerales bacterium]|jgi:phosphoribosylformimino-5-aminoimidazole carboxamide ribotide isomerase|nr:1-(5-phosphoribosyl)-5-[(5-phosphoribosylamino)methylideneamino]imidazole-4-carboxamide isomerase [Sedimentisphaerales bacterium]HNU30390.1 1-(5-phosphoribosyl)-5-[(5-phosphoribosylamino)methylideneamino]imidazole-4-carboxamide isomerase [Sedimentisphaerales bacterium]
MDVIPAIDLRDGQCVRLIQGQYDRQITYNDDPAQQARRFYDDGARWLHIVDLDGAKEGRPINTASIAEIAELGLLQIEVGGGIRDEASIRELIDLGVTRIIIGTKAVSDFEWFSDMAYRFKGRLVLGLDARGSMVATHGWLEDSSQPLLEFAARADKLPLAAIIYTDITKDGMLTGPNIERTAALVAAVKTPVIASGGVKEAADIQKLIPIRVAGVIVGRSLYEGTLDLKDAIAAAK